jgi:hypothetical protein
MMFETIIGIVAVLTLAVSLVNAFNIYRKARHFNQVVAESFRVTDRGTIYLVEQRAPVVAGVARDVTVEMLDQSAGITYLQARAQ